MENVDDVTGEALIQRDDDAETTVRDRLSVYQEQTHPLVEFYRAQADAKGANVRYVSVDGLADVENVQKDIFKKLRN